MTENHTTRIALQAERVLDVLEMTAIERRAGIPAIISNIMSPLNIHGKNCDHEMHQEPPWRHR